MASSSVESPASSVRLAASAGAGALTLSLMSFSARAIFGSSLSLS
jgi:hypothetical protein